MPGAGAAVGAVVTIAISINGIISNGPDSLEGIFGMIFLPLTTGLGALLDVDAALSKSELYVAFQKNYPFVDNHEALSNLAESVKEKFAKFAEANPAAKEAYITLSREEVASALETADITDAQFEQIASDLK